MQSAGITIPDGMAVAIAMPAYGPIPAHTARSLFATAVACERLGIRCDLIITSGLIELARDLCLSDFLEGDAHKLFWIDSDMVWEPETFLRMLALSTKVDVLCATYPQKVEGPNTFIVLAEPGQPTGDYGLLPIKGAGLGFTVVDRKVCQAVSDAAPLITDPINQRQQRAVFRVDVINGHRRTEDMAFFADIADLGYTIWLDPNIELGHMGLRQWRGRLIDAIMAAQPAQA